MRRWLFLGRFLDSLKNFLQIGFRKIPPIQNDGRHFLGVTNVLERVGVEEHKIREFSLLYGTELIFHLEKARGIQCGGLQGFQRSETGCDEAL